MIYIGIHIRLINVRTNCILDVFKCCRPLPRPPRCIIDWFGNCLKNPQMLQTWTCGYRFFPHLINLVSLAIQGLSLYPKDVCHICDPWFSSPSFATQPRVTCVTWARVPGAAYNVLCSHGWNNNHSQCYSLGAVRDLSSHHKINESNCAYTNASIE